MHWAKYKKGRDFSHQKTGIEYFTLTRHTFDTQGCLLHHFFKVLLSTHQKILKLQTNLLKLNLQFRGIMTNPAIKLLMFSIKSQVNTRNPLPYLNLSPSAYNSFFSDLSDVNVWNVPPQFLQTSSSNTSFQ